MQRERADLLTDAIGDGTGRGMHAGEHGLARERTRIVDERTNPAGPQVGAQSVAIRGADWKQVIHVAGVALR